MFFVKYTLNNEMNDIAAYIHFARFSSSLLSLADLGKKGQKNILQVVVQKQITEPAIGFLPLICTIRQSFHATGMSDRKSMSVHAAIG